MIYDTSGTQLYSAYDVDGNDLNIAYDINENTVYPSSPITPTIKVMTYNVRWFQDFNSQSAMQTKIINDNNADIIGLQELSKNGAIPSLGQTVLSGYDYKQLSAHKNYLGIASKLSISNYSTADFEHQDSYDWSQYQETRAYQKCNISAGGKTITWFNAHLCFHDRSVKAQQMMEILALAEQEDYCIITGDFNSDCQSVNDADYIAMMKPFVDAGYKLANNTQSRGFTKTWTDSATATSTEQMTDATDNIIVSGNITITSINFDTTKFSYLNGQSIDHVPIVVGLLIN